jgi:hypothetical protein
MGLGFFLGSSGPWSIDGNRLFPSPGASEVEMKLLSLALTRTLGLDRTGLIVNIGIYTSIDFKLHLFCFILYKTG